MTFPIYCRQSRSVVDVQKGICSCVNSAFAGSFGFGRLRPSADGNSYPYCYACPHRDAGAYRNTAAYAYLDADSYSHAHSGADRYTGAKACAG